jgi:hypothetical protein
MNITPTILRKKIEEIQCAAQSIVSLECHRSHSFQLFSLHQTPVLSLAA